MKKICLLLLVMLFVSPVFGATEDPYVTSSTVSFNTVGKVVTFNSAVRNILFINDPGSSGNLYVQMNPKEIGWNGMRDTYTLPQLNGLNFASGTVVRLVPGDSMSLNWSGNKTGFVGTGDGTITWVATSDKEL